MCGLAHYLEDEGLATVIVALVREHIVSMNPPRALWVPFELGRPFGAPNDAQLQMRVLRAALALLDRTDSGLILEDYDEQVPYPDGDPNWQSPDIANTDDVLIEAASLQPASIRAQRRFGKSTVGISGLTAQAAVEFIARYHSDDPMPNPKGMALVSRARFAIDDIKAFYFEAAMSREGHPSSHQIREWFWNQTLAGVMVREFQDRALKSDDQNLNKIAGSLVPAERTFGFLSSQPD